MQGAEQFTEAGGEDFAALSCLNASDAGMDMLETIIRRELSGWI
jgi:ferrochelatase